MSGVGLRSASLAGCAVCLLLFQPASAGLSGAPDWSFSSGQPSAYMGSAVSAGDINGDGYSDLIVGAHTYDGAGGMNSGRVTVHHGSASGLSATPDWTMDGSQYQGYFGFAVSVAGDVNGDGYDDVIIGAPKEDEGENDEGRAHVFHGSSSGLGPSPNWTVESGQIGAWLGGGVAWAGDVNGDGYDDVLVGAHKYDGGNLDEGRVYAYLGSSSGLAPAPVWIMECDQDSANLGAWIATAGDVNGDGYDDVFLGSAYYTNDLAREGAAWVFHGNSSGISSAFSWNVEGNQAEARYGYSGGTAGDVNGDGYADLVVGAFLWDGDDGEEGRVRVYHGSASGLSTTHAAGRQGNQDGCYFGTSSFTAGDVNGDGYADVIASASLYDGSFDNAGQVRLYLGSSTGIGGQTWTFEGAQDTCYVGVSVRPAGDVNGDGFGDVVVGATFWDDQFTNEGAVFVFHGTFEPPTLFTTVSVDSIYLDDSGAAGDVDGDGYDDVIVGLRNYGVDYRGRALIYKGSAQGVVETPLWSVDGIEAGERFGQAVAGAGDVNGDGFSDVIVGAPLSGSIDGRAALYLGGAAGPASVPDWEFLGTDGSYLGYSVAAAGDVNGDGYGDVVVSSPLHNAGSLNMAGRVQVFHGSETGLGSTADWTRDGDDSHWQIGWSVSSAGDVNGDGYSDVVIGSPDYGQGAQYDEGRADLFLGSASGLSTNPAWTIEGDARDAYFGAGVAAAGDVNGDGYGDVLVRAAHPHNALLYLGSSTGLSTVPAWTFDASSCYVLCPAGDLDRDGFSDWMARSADQAALFLGSPNGVPRDTLYLPMGSGWSGAAAGDVNGDGFDDITGVDWETDVVFSYHGNGSGTDRIPRQETLSGDPVDLLGFADSPSQFLLTARGRSAAGRSRVRLEWQVSRYAIPVTGAALHVGAWDVTGTPDAEGSYVGLQAVAPFSEGDELHHWRLRIASDSPFFPLTPWFTMSRTVPSMAQLRSGLPPGTGVVIAGPGPSSDLRLELAGPNPFRGEAHLRITAAAGRRVSLDVVSVAGRRIRRLLTDAEAAGPLSVVWDGKDAAGRFVPAGVYFARLDVDDETLGRKLVLLR